MAFDSRNSDLWQLSLQRSDTTDPTPIGIALENLRQRWGHERTYAQRRELRSAAGNLRKALAVAFPPHRIPWQTTVTLAILSTLAIIALYRIST
jgi:hypothetical protein